MLIVELSLSTMRLFLRRTKIKENTEKIKVMQMNLIPQLIKKEKQ